MVFWRFFMHAQIGSLLSLTFAVGATVAECLIQELSIAAAALFVVLVLHGDDASEEGQQTEARLDHSCEDAERDLTLGAHDLWQKTAGYSRVVVTALVHYLQVSQGLMPVSQLAILSIH